MSLTYNQAIEELANIPATKEALLELASKVSVATLGEVTYFPRSHSPSGNAYK